MKLLVCDDDISTIDVIQSQLDLRQLGINRFFRAYNGKMAEEIIDKERPDLILCDIDMPICNGIHVLEHAYEVDKDIEFSFLTCYEKFEYAQKAIQYGATSYLTKPFQLEEVKACIQKMAANVRKKRLTRDSRDRNDALLSSIFRQASEGVLGTNRNIVDAALATHGIDFRADSSWRIVFSCGDMTDAIRKTWNKDLLLFTASRLHDEAILDYVGSAHCVVNSDDRFIWCFCFVPATISEEVLQERCEKLISFCENYLSIDPVILISGTFPFYETANMVCDLYERMRKIRYYSGRIFHEDQQIEALPADNIELNENQILWYLKKRDEAGYSEYIASLLEGMDGTKEELDALRKELINVFITHFRDNGIRSNTVFMDENVKAADENACLSKTHMAEYARVLFALQQSEVQSVLDSEDIIVRAKKYIDENFRENIDRNDVASITFVTPNYLSKLFKNSMNMNLREYINQLRIEEAKRLLLSTPMSVSEIASYVGYYNISYFSTVFHKVVGVSPFDWRNQKEGNDDTK